MSESVMAEMGVAHMDRYTLDQGIQQRKEVFLPDLFLHQFTSYHLFLTVLVHHPPADK